MVPISSDDRSFKFRLFKNEDLTTESRVAAALTTIREGKGLDRLMKYDKKPLIDEVETESQKVVTESEKIQHLINAEFHRRTQFEKHWQDNEQAIHRMIAKSTYPLQGIFHCLVFLSIVVFNILIGPVTVDAFALLPRQNSFWILMVLLVMQTFVFLPAFEISKRRLERRSRIVSLPASESYNISIFSIEFSNWLPGVLLLLMSIVTVLFLAQVAISPGLGFLLAFAFVALAILLFIGYTAYEERLVSSQAESDDRIADMYKREQQSKAEHLRSIDKLVVDIVMGIVRDLEEEHDLNLSRWRTTIPDYPSAESWKHLGEYYDTYIDTANLTDLKESISNFTKASFGVAGERGAGKTALMKQLKENLDSDGQDDFLTVWMSAPTSVNERELPISILARLATCVGEKLSGNRSWPDFPPLKSLRINNHYRRWTRIGISAFIFALAAGTISMIPSVIPSLSPPSILNLIEFAPLASMLLLFASVLCLFYRARHFSTRSYFFSPGNIAEDIPDTIVSKSDRPLVFASVDLLEALWYERKDTLSSNVSLSWLGTSIGSHSGTEKTREPFTLPRLVDMWQEYVEQITANRFRRVIIFIDEVDKLGGRSRIEQFIRVLKALYDAPKVFFVVSISNDAYEWFHERHSPAIGRNIFDSSFSHVLCVTRQRCNDLEKLLNVRVIGSELPTPVVQLIWVLSNGNPRDAQRLAIEVIKYHNGKSLREAAGRLCAKQFRWVFEPYRASVHSKALYSAPLSLLASGNIATDKISIAIHEAINDVQNWMKSRYDKADVRTLSSQIIAELQYALIVYSIFCCYENVSGFRKLNKPECDKLIRSVQKRLSQQYPYEAQELLMELRTRVALQ